MAVSTARDYPPDLSETESEYLLSTLKDWSIANGLAVRPPPAFVPRENDPKGVLAVNAPVTLFPSLFPKSCFEQACQVQTAYNELYASISRDEEWLGEIMSELIEVDDFIANLWETHLKVKEEGYVQDLSLGLLRSDYMVHVDPKESSPAPQIKQVEFNTIASSFGGLASQVSLLHKYLFGVGAYPPSSDLPANSFPPNPATTSLALGLESAHLAYGPSKSSHPLPLCILFVVQSPERNVFDQRHLEYVLRSHKSIPVFRLPFPSTLSLTHIPPDNPSRPLIYTPPHSPNTPHEVTLLYFRSTYSPADYPDPSSWHSRHHLERSAAIKCPSILTHLAGSKKVQQVLATPHSSHLSRFLPPDSQPLAQVQQTFTAIYPLDSSPAGQHAKSLATDPATAQHYVLKPQREGGGNNIYRSAIPNFLKKLGDERKWRGHILMEIIEPPTQRNSIIRNGELRSGEVVVELGVYGVCLWRHGEGGGGIGHVGSGNAGNGDGEDQTGVSKSSPWWLLRNKEAGYLLRTKGRESEEGGVAAGFGAVDSVALVDG